MVRRVLTIGVLLGASGAAIADDVSIGVDLPFPSAGTYELTGQSAMILTTPSGFSTGGQLDGVQSPGAGIGYTEVFPPPNFSDYQSFGYFGRILTRDGSGMIVDTSLIVAFQPGSGVGQMIGDVFAGMDEATLVAALDSFDTPEFFDLLSGVVGNASTLGAVELPPIGRPGDTLDLVAFIAGPGGDVGAKVGELTFSITPAPGVLGVLGVGMIAASRRRR